MRGKLNLYVFNLFLALSSCNFSSDHVITVFAASSLTTALTEITFEFEQKYPTIAIRLNFASSSMLARQIMMGANADVFLSANEQWMNALQQKQFVDVNSRLNLLSNKLVVISSKNSKMALAELADLTHSKVKRIALADWTHVPAGIYAKQMLEKSNVWRRVNSKCLPALDVRAALSYVARGDAEVGLVYKSDAIISENVTVQFQPVDSLQTAIVYPVAAITKNKKAGSEKFFLFLQSSVSRKIFQKNQFGTMF